MVLQFENPHLTKLDCGHILSLKFEDDHNPSCPAWKMKAEPSYTKLRGGYYTPEPIARFLAKWAIRSSAGTILEPSCGDGVFIDAATDRQLELGATPDQIAAHIQGYEIDKGEASKAASRLHKRGVRKPEIQIHAADFFEACAHPPATPKVDVVLGNPPFIRYQNFPEKQRTLAFEVMHRAGLNPNRLTNIWVPFLVGAALLLKPHGRLGMVIPAELLQVTYAAELRRFLSEYFRQITVLTFRCLAFSEVQQEVVLLLAKRGNEKTGGIEVRELEGIEALSRYRPDRFGLNGFKTVDHTVEKWTQYFLSQREIEFIRELRNELRLTSLGSVADTDIGVVTGMNDFFVMTADHMRAAELEGLSRPIVCRSNHLPGIIFRRKDWNQNVRSGLAVHLLDLPAVRKQDLPLRARKYVSLGELRKLHLGYKCRIRKRWYIVPSVYAPDAFLLRQIHHYPKLVVNETGATCTDTIHRIRFRRGVDARNIAAAFLNSLTLAFAELTGRSYGGGVLELEPNEADKLPIPLINAERLDPEQIDDALRQHGVREVLAQTDRILLREGLGLARSQIEELNSIWQKLRGRRTGRRHGQHMHSGALVDMGRPALIPQEVCSLDSI